MLFVSEIRTTMTVTDCGSSSPVTVTLAAAAVAAVLGRAEEGVGDHRPDDHSTEFVSQVSIIKALKIAGYALGLWGLAIEYSHQYDHYGSYLGLPDFANFNSFAYITLLGAFMRNVF